MDKPFNFIFLYNKMRRTFNYDDLRAKLKAKLPNVTLYLISTEDKEKEIEQLPTKDIQMLTTMPFFATHIPYIMKALPSIKWIHSATSGIEPFFAIDEIKNLSPGYYFSNSKGAYSDSLAEWSVLALLYFNYNIPTFIESNEKKEWTKAQNQLIQQKTVLIYGYGGNGVALAKRVKPAFNMKIIAVIREKRDNIEGKEFCDEIYTFEEVTKEIIFKSDFIYATLPQTPKTINIFDANFFNSMNKNAVFINIGRGTAVVEKDIADALNNNTIRGALLDVTQKEPLDKTSPLYDIGRNKLLITNHSVGFTPVIEPLCYDRIIENIEFYLKNGKPKHIVNIKEQY